MELLPTVLWQGAGLSVAVTRDGDAVFRAAGDAALVPEQVVTLCLDLLAIYSPECVAAIERAARASRLRLVQGGGDGPGAAA
jgi:hypothetical protein